MSNRMRKFAITSTDHDVGSILIDETELLKALGYEIDDDGQVPALEDELIKYEPIATIKRKGSTLSIFIRYIFTGERIESAVVLRIKYGADHIDFVCHDSSTLREISNALKRAKYRVDKTNDLNKRYGFCQKKMKQLYQSYTEIRGRTLAEILSTKHQNRENND